MCVVVFIFHTCYFEQLDHRILAATTLFAIGSMWFSTRNVQMHPAVEHLVKCTVGMTVLQVCIDDALEKWMYLSKAFLVN
jgi:hypothetical protein